MLLSSLESLLNRSIADAASAQALCKRLQDYVLAVHVTGVNLSLYCRSTGEQLRLSTTHDGKANASISGSPLSLISLVARPPEAQIRSGSVHIEGDAEIAQNFQKLFKAARPDIEEELSRLIGDVAAHRIGSLARETLSFGQRAATTFAQNATEYLQEESRDLPTRFEVNEFADEVDHLRDAVERVEARLALVEHKLS